MAKNNALQREESSKRDSKFLAQLESKFRPNISLPFCSAPKPFPEAGTRSSASGFCILCADKDHLLLHHPKDKNKFSDGKPIWGRLGDDNKLCGPNGQEVCIRFNISGRSACFGPKKHVQTRAHVCSFCGDKNHHALSFTCCPHP